jgi:Ca2+-binding EF-hand superfamily protein
MPRLARTLPIAIGTLGIAACFVLAQQERPGGREGRFGGGPAAFPLMRALDTDGDGELSAKEIENATASLKTLDKDKNGKLTRDELFPAMGRLGGRGQEPGPDVSAVVAALMSFDKNGDGKLSKDELPERMKVLMDRADANKDGFPDKAELTAYAQRQGQRGPGAGPGDGPSRKGGGRRGGGEPRTGSDA